MPVVISAQVAVLDGEDVHGSGECFGGGSVFVAFRAPRGVSFSQLSGLFLKFDLALADAGAGGALGIELVFEVGAAVGGAVA